jgi:hypothetical protein
MSTTSVPAPTWPPGTHIASRSPGFRAKTEGFTQPQVQYDVRWPRPVVNGDLRNSR